MKKILSFYGFMLTSTKTCTCYLMVLATLLFIGQSVTLTAQESWDLKKCLDYAKSNNVPLKQLGINEKSAFINKKESEAAKLPNANGSGSYNYSFGRNIDVATNDFVTEAIGNVQWGLSSNMTLYNGGIIKNTEVQRDMEYNLAKLETESQWNDIELATLSAYMNILLAEAQLEVLQKQADQTKQNYEQTKKLVRAGVAPSGQLLDIEAQMANDQLNQVNAQNNIATAYLTLGQTINYYEPIKVVKPQLKTPSTEDLQNVSPLTVYQAALNTQPSLKANDLRLTIAEQSLKIAEGAKMPVIGLGANIGSRYSTLGRRATGETTFNPPLSLVHSETGAVVITPLNVV
ncbi:MAG: TolC family protein, partial [Chitinophagales bacterium]